MLMDLQFKSSFRGETGEHRPPFALEHLFVENNGDGQPTVGILDNVKKIMVHHFFGYKIETEFNKHLLQKADVLETLSLTYHRLELNPESFGRRYTIALLNSWFGSRRDF
ncbi:hypothetical protein PVK06_010917 [Gossypium arboreum]|uniref:Uncharacterized protein n=1 Tax=Gossypium arboreum TaxID=29729 RepID=A0ABR0Q7J0_GOSAR|nr:hypothetical protein PVK06_010917 [Gossypium arboreum]